MKQIEFITVLDLYAYAKENNLLDARIRICDGMAVSYYPCPRSLSKSRYEIVIDVSADEPIGYDELDECARTWHRSKDRPPTNWTPMHKPATPVTSASWTTDCGGTLR